MKQALGNEMELYWLFMRGFLVRGLQPESEME